ncbi:CCA tRNA nucleotidyltransferase [Clostridium thailandense]|uniref:CCA tRNA nucleotidyltransferase n=1 Tax=Clostridium thailandense TaxID=2794346 RepID=UPI0039890C77
MNIFNSFDQNQMYVINAIKYVCINHNIKAYIVGGAVRDSILGENIKDIDICINENPKVVIDNLSNMQKYEYYQQFQTSTIKFNNGITIDLIRCRKETYERDGTLPEIEPSNIEDDLYRRDFTINSLAYDIVNNRIIDLYNGIKDLKNKQLKKIHINSYMEDPTRVFRGIRYSTRYGFELYDKEEIQECIKSKIIQSISFDRIIKELYLMCREKKWIENFILCNQLGLLELDNKYLGIKSQLESYDNINLRILSVFYALKNDKYIDVFISNSFLDKDLKKSMKYYYFTRDKMIDLLMKPMDNYEMYQILKSLDLYGLILCGWNNKVSYKVINYFYNLKDIRLDSDGRFLNSLGISSGRNMGKILKNILKLKLNMGIKDDKKYLLCNLGEITKCL